MSDWIRISPDNGEYLGYVEGYIATSDPDAHGDAIPPRLIEEMAQTIQRDPELQVIRLQHDTTQRTGRVLEVKVDRRRGWAGLRARVGVFKNRPDVWRMFEAGELRGFSVAVGVLDYTGKVGISRGRRTRWFRVIVPGIVWHDVDDLLRRGGADTYPLVRKALPAEAIITVACAAASVAPLIVSMVGWLRRRSKGSTDDSNGVDISIVVEEERIRLTPETAEQIVRRIKLSRTVKKTQKGS